MLWYVQFVFVGRLVTHLVSTSMECMCVFYVCRIEPSHTANLPQRGVDIPLAFVVVVRLARPSHIGWLVFVLFNVVSTAHCTWLHTAVFLTYYVNRIKFLLPTSQSLQ